MSGTWIVINSKGRQILSDSWDTKEDAELALVNLIYGTCLSDDRKGAIKYLYCRVWKKPKYRHILSRDGSGYLTTKKILNDA